ncbi:MAG: hypothetical protein V7L09_03440, partial [Nostoc sp.]|uniref:hypothetical protein n=1 Tax=Nostoc sp. TaxID=1180 RepID=UPI002FF3BD03
PLRLLFQNTYESNRRVRKVFLSRQLIHPASPPAGRGWGWGSSGLISNQADMISLVICPL